MHEITKNPKNNNSNNPKGITYYLFYINYIFCQQLSSEIFTVVIFPYILPISLTVQDCLQRCSFVAYLL